MPSGLYEKSYPSWQYGLQIFDPPGWLKHARAPFFGLVRLAQVGAKGKKRNKSTIKSVSDNDTYYTAKITFLFQGGKAYFKKNFLEQVC